MPFPIIDPWAILIVLLFACPAVLGLLCTPWFVIAAKFRRGWAWREALVRQVPLLVLWGVQCLLILSLFTQTRPELALFWAIVLLGVLEVGLAIFTLRSWRVLVVGGGALPLSLLAAAAGGCGGGWVAALVGLVLLCCWGLGLVSWARSNPLPRFGSYPHSAQPRRCAKCLYDLTGLETARVCPECGSSTLREGHAHQPAVLPPPRSHRPEPPAHQPWSTE